MQEGFFGLQTTQGASLACTSPEGAPKKLLEGVSLLFVLWTAGFEGKAHVRCEDELRKLRSPLRVARCSRRAHHCAVTRSGGCDG